jgi:hypothetical protein
VRAWVISVQFLGKVVEIKAGAYAKYDIYAE